MSAYTEVAALASKTVDEHDPFFRESYLSASSLRDWVRDANAVAQEKGVEAACAVVAFGGKGMARSVDTAALTQGPASRLTILRVLQNTIRGRAQPRREVPRLCTSTCTSFPQLSPDHAYSVLLQAGTRTKSIELCLLYVEGEEDMAEGVIVRSPSLAPTLRLPS